jgi:hypothetical protein
MWHRIFGQDVTLWGPTHLMLLTGAGLSLVAMAILEREGELATGSSSSPIGRYVRRGMMMGGMLIGLSVYQAEFDYGVPQFRLVHQPLLIAMASAAALVAARLWVGRGAALFAVGFYYVLRGGVSVVVAGVIGQLWSAVPLYVAEALLVELAAAFLLSPSRRRPLALGVVSGLLIGTVGFACEYVWSAVVMPHPWNGDMVVEGVLMAVAGGLAGGVSGALLGMGLQGRLPRRAQVLYGGSIVLLAAALANGLIVDVPTGVRAEISLAGITPTAADSATVRFTPASAVDNPTWLEITGWQGGGLHVDHLVPGPDGTWHTTQPVPLGGGWKDLVRVHDGRTMAGVPVFLPADPALGAVETPALPDATRDAVPEKLILQREQKADVPSWLWGAAAVVVLLCTLTLLVALGWGTARVSRGEETKPAPRAPARS